MQYLYIATVFAGALVCLLASLLLFLRRKAGERSRIILAVIVLFSVFNYIPRFISLSTGEVPHQIVSAEMLLLAIFMVLSYILYPLEVISPGWLNFRNLFKLLSVWLLLVFAFLISLWSGVQYTPYSSVLEMLPHAGEFEVWFRLLLSLLIFLPVLLIFYIHRSRRYRNTNLVWLKKYSSVLLINILAYIMVLVFNHQFLHILYYYLSVGCSLFIVYMELFDRLIGKPETDSSGGISAGDFSQAQNAVVQGEQVADSRNTILAEKMNAYMKNNSAWRDPDLSLNALASELCTNRTTLAKVIQESGCENYTCYINKLRIDDFIQQMESGKFDNFQDAFFFAGFRSRSTALRNFRQITGKIPSEYFLTES
ncbi:MAG: hypothetical protein CVT97_04065 [Bacteroidetes bacterium HGW-Bacteroidetes-14]|jgi:AraC-like DNA-binding protein|nr:MAG: hypothetical protein CVT97_04065 [Bacteroidetes bacterium HGW-Bacteroidetes-14]